MVVDHKTDEDVRAMEKKDLDTMLDATDLVVIFNSFSEGMVATRPPARSCASRPISYGIFVT